METAVTADPIRLWVLTDGRAGNEAQALGLAEAIARARPTEIEIKRIELKSWAAWLPAGLSNRLGSRHGTWPFAGLVDRGASLRWPWPDCVIGAGRRAAPTVAALRRRHAIVAIQLLDPRMQPSAFDALVVPSHDKVTGANVLSSVGALNRITASRVAHEAAAWASKLARLPTPRLAVLIGGPSGSATFADSDATRLSVALERLARSHTLLVTTSRRSPEGLANRLAAALGARAFIRGPGDAGPNLYPGMLGHADAVLVTEDSVNMASEAASTGLPVHVFPLTRVAPKITQFHQTLMDRGASRRFTGDLANWAYKPLAEADRIASDLLRRGII